MIIGCFKRKDTLTSRAYKTAALLRFIGTSCPCITTNGYIYRQGALPVAPDSCFSLAAESGKKKNQVKGWVGVICTKRRAKWVHQEMVLSLLKTSNYTNCTHIPMCPLQNQLIAKLCRKSGCIKDTSVSPPINIFHR